MPAGGGMSFRPLSIAWRAHVGSNAACSSSMPSGSRNRCLPLIAEAEAKVLVLDLSGVFDLEYSALKMLTDAEKRGREAGTTLWIAGLTPEVYAAVQRSPLGKTLGLERMKYSVEIAVDDYHSLHGETLPQMTFETLGEAHA
jgi:anti-anti-sigma regulatory factor